MMYWRQTRKDEEKKNMNMRVEENLEEKSNIVAACRTTTTTLSSPSYSYITKKRVIYLS
jgi:hypothetical protein